VARRRPPPRRKTRTREHVIADLAINHVERQIILCGWTVERMVHDYGVDLTMYTFDAVGEVQNGDVAIQVKATERIRNLSSRQAISFPIARSDLVTWLAETMPVILVLYDVASDRAYWLYVQAYFERLTRFNLFRVGETVTVRIPVAQVLDTAAVRRFAAFRDAVNSQLAGVVRHHD
jgi:hypothetical protein